MGKADKYMKVIRWCCFFALAEFFAVCWWFNGVKTAFAATVGLVSLCFAFGWMLNRVPVYRAPQG